MWGHNLKRRGRWWHYYRAVPERYANVEARREVCFSLRTQDFAEAKLKAAQICRATIKVRVSIASL